MSILGMLGGKSSRPALEVAAARMLPPVVATAPVDAPPTPAIAVAITASWATAADDAAAAAAPAAAKGSGTASRSGCWAALSDALLPDEDTPPDEADEVKSSPSTDAPLRRRPVMSAA